MNTTAHLWAIGYDDMGRADQVKDEITRLGWGEGLGGKYLFLEDVAVAVRHLDGSFTINREPFPFVGNILASTTVGFLAGLALAMPLTGAALGTLIGSSGSALAARVGLGDDFIRDAETLMKPGTSALFVMDQAAEMDVILHTIRGLGGRVLKTNVDPERAKLIQSTLLADSAYGSKQESDDGNGSLPASAVSLDGTNH
jgi:uncharacterized membrane protein